MVKVERPEGGDDTRSWGPPYLGDPAAGLSAYFLAVNRNKRSVALDLRSGAGRQLFLELAAHSDVVIENFAPGVAERLGLEARRPVRGQARRRALFDYRVRAPRAGARVRSGDSGAQRADVGDR